MYSTYHLSSVLVAQCIWQSWTVLIACVCVWGGGRERGVRARVGAVVYAVCACVRVHVH